MTLVHLKKVSTLIALLIAGLLSACTNMGPKLAQHDDLSYNTAIQNTAARELLLNIVRLRYNDIPLFLEITNISAGYRISKSANATLTGVLAPRTLPTYNATLGVTGTYEQNPIINFIPLKGSKYVTEMLSPIPLSSLAA